MKKLFFLLVAIAFVSCNDGGDGNTTIPGLQKMAAVKADTTKKVQSIIKHKN